MGIYITLLLRWAKYSSKIVVKNSWTRLHNWRVCISFFLFLFPLSRASLLALATNGTCPIALYFFLVCPACLVHLAQRNGGPHFF